MLAVALKSYNSCFKFNIITKIYFNKIISLQLACVIWWKGAVAWKYGIYKTGMHNLQGADFVCEGEKSSGRGRVHVCGTDDYNDSRSEICEFFLI